MRSGGRASLTSRSRTLYTGLVSIMFPPPLLDGERLNPCVGFSASRSPSFNEGRGMTSKSVLRQQVSEAIDRIAQAAASISSDEVDVQEKAEELRNVRERDYQHTEAARLQKTAELLESVQAAQGLEPKEPIKKTVNDLESVNNAQAQNLRARGMEKIEVLRQQSDEDIAGVDGIGKKTVKDIRDEIGYPEENE